MSGEPADGAEDLSEGDSLELVCLVRAQPAVAKVYWALDVSRDITIIDLNVIGFVLFLYFKISTTPFPASPGPPPAG